MPVPSNQTPTKVTITYDQYNEITINSCHEYNFYVKAINYKGLPLDANVREPDEKAKPYKEMLKTLEFEPEKFFENNLGISVIATDVVLKGSSKVELSFNSGTGILNGGHTQAALLASQEFGNIDKATVRITIRMQNYNEARIAEIAAAQNSCSNVKEYSLAEKRGLNVDLKKSLDVNKEKFIVWWEGRDVPNNKGMNPEDLIAMLNVFNIFNYASEYNHNSIKQPNSSSSSRGSVYSSWEKAQDADLENYKKIYPLVNDILDLWEYIAYTGYKQTGITSFEVVAKTKKTDGTRRTLFKQYDCEYEIPKQMQYAVFAAFRANVYYDHNRRQIGWFCKNEKLFDEYKKDLFTRVKTYFKTNGNEPNKFSKDPTIWEVLYSALDKHIDRTKPPVITYPI